MKKFLALLLCLCMIFTTVALASCDNAKSNDDDEEIEEEEKDDKDEDEDDKKKDDEDDKKKDDEDEDDEDEVLEGAKYFYGDWECEFPLGEEFSAYLEDALTLDADFSDFEDFAFVVVFSFDKKGDFECYIDEDDFFDDMDAIFDDVYDICEARIEEYIEEEELDMTVDEVCEEEFGENLEEALELVLYTLYEEVADEMNLSGVFDADEDMLYIAEDEDELEILVEDGEGVEYIVNSAKEFEVPDMDMTFKKAK